MSGRFWAYLGVVLGGAVSIAANVAHTYVAVANPPALAVAFSVFWPVALFVAVEILARTAWPSGRRWVLLRFGGLLPVALVAAVVSYRHLSGLLAYYGEDPLTVAIGPLAVDGLMVVATGALIATGKQRPVVTPERAEPARPADATPAVAVTPAPVEVAAPVDATPAAKKPANRPRPKSLTSAEKVARAAAKLPGATVAQIAAKAGVSESTARRYLTSPTGPQPAETPVNGRAPEFAEVAS